MSKAAAKRLTWVAGDRPEADLDEVSRKNLAAHRSTPPHGPCDTRSADGTLNYQESTGTSIFDPVLCELIYRWFTPVGGQIIDPFAGGSVRGIVAAKLGRAYWGCDLSERQIIANREQAGRIVPDKMPEWVVGDSRDQVANAPEADLLFSCPPYADLEVYSDDPRDLSTMDYPTFRLIYREIIGKACARLRPDRFACFVVGEVRSKLGSYYGLVPDTIAAFQDAGMRFYNEAILLTAVGSLPIRAGRAFEASRKLGKTHQNVLVFVKGDPQKAAKAMGDVSDMEWLTDDLAAAENDAASTNLVPVRVTE